MNIWVIKEGEDLPIRNNCVLGRTGSLANYLSKNGHNVIWWASTFCHGSKKYLCNKTRVTCVHENEKIIMLHSRIFYRKNVSLLRIIYHENLAKKFRELSVIEEKPDVILCSWPTQQFAKACVEYGEKHNVPVVIDIRDMWPDYFLRVFPKWAKRIGKWMLSPLRKDAQKTLAKADAIIGVIPSFVRWGVTLAEREVKENDRHIYIGRERIDEDYVITKGQIERWGSLGITSDKWILCLIGTLSKQGDYDTLISAAKKVAINNKNFRLVIAGDGDERQKLEELAEDCPSIVFPGWLNNEEVISLLSLSSCGAFSYKNSDGFKDSISNKVVQYYSAGLPVVSSLEGLSKELMSKYGMAVFYKEGNVEECFNAIDYLINNERERNEMRSASLKLFEDYFDSDVVNAQFHKMLDDVIREHKCKQKVRDDK